MTPQERTILADACRVVGVTMEVLGSKRRGQRIAHQRQEWCWLVRRATGMSYPHIGKLINRDHSTIIYAYQQIEKHFNNGGHSRLSKALYKVKPPYWDPLGSSLCDFTPPISVKASDTALGDMIRDLEIRREGCYRRIKALNATISRLKTGETSYLEATRQ